MTFREIRDVVLAASAADETEVVFTRHDQSLTRFANNHIHQNVTESNHEVAVRCIRGTRIGIAVSNDIRPASLKALVDRACDLARLQPENPEFKGLPHSASIPSVTAFSAEAASCSPMRRADGVGVVCRMARAAGYTAAGSMTTGRALLGVANSHGVFVEHESSLTDASTVVMTESSSGWAQDSGWKMDAVDWEALGREAMDKARRSENPSLCEPGEYTVVLDPYAVADLLEMLAYDGMGAMAFQEERSWLNGRIGTPIMADKVSIVDDALSPFGIPVPFDFEGQPKHVVAIVDRGVARGPVYDSFCAGRATGVQSTGHATPPSPTSRYGPLPMNLTLRSGDSSLDEMIRSTPQGVYITRFWYTRPVNPRDMVVTGMTRDGTFMIRNGEIAEGVKSLRFTQSYIEALAATVAVGRRLKVLKTEFGAIVVPAVKLGRFRFTSATR